MGSPRVIWGWWFILGQSLGILSRAAWISDSSLSDRVNLRCGAIGVGGKQEGEGNSLPIGFAHHPVQFVPGGVCFP
ncbi:hypothetical protein B0H16DRAFT_550645 [Mycena metata]|uniref:Uncharacterized protein n=1 Tax=Mycena metata TaxID=1033252 RepID=A0AAD7H693_9AGAR|nr:hypothetical protein B0H16DRAFT_550645 [Mycena metata]